MAQPVIIDTDIGTDIDDSWALAVALRCPELDIRLVTVSTGEPTYRATLAADLLAAAGRPDVPIGLGASGGGDQVQPLRSLADRGTLDQHPGGAADGVTAMLDTVAASPEPVTIVALGPLTTVAAALRQRPDLARRARLVGMHGSLRHGYQGAAGAVPEYNVATDVDAARAVFAAPWTCTLTPLDTCGTVVLDGARYRAVRDAGEDDRLVRALLRQQRVWLTARGRAELFEQRTTTLFDTVAVALAYDESLVELEDVAVSLRDDGTMVAVSDGPRLRLATEWRDQARFLDHVVERLSADAGRPVGARSRGVGR